MKKLFMVLAATLICGACVFTSCKKEDDLNVKEKIIGKWMLADVNGQPAPTNEKSVTTFVSATKAYMSTSRSNYSESNPRWAFLLEYDVEIEGNKVKFTGHYDEQTTLINEYIVSTINDAELVGKWKHITIRNGVETSNTENDFRLVKQTADYAEPILGLWECQELTGIETYNAANARLEFFADGTYNYWRKNDGGEWEAVTNREFQNYFVDGTLLATRWKNIGEEELREWWEIANIANGEMQWTALRQNADGTTAQQGMKWSKVNE